MATQRDSRGRFTGSTPRRGRQAPRSGAARAQAQRDALDALRRVGAVIEPAEHERAYEAYEAYEASLRNTSSS